MLRFLLVLAALFQCACATQRAIRDRAYNPAVEAYQRSDPEQAYEFVPRGEEGGFITTVEKGWLAFWSKKAWDEKPLQAQVDTFDQRRYTSISRETDYFLFQESEEGYVPSEHEIVLLHLISAMHFSETGRVEDAKVELRRAGYVLDRYWDDPSLRIWLGSLWAALGEWNEAQVDFRRAGVLSGKKDWIRLADGPPPPDLTLHFFGNGPVMEWMDGQYEPQFKPDTQNPPVGAQYVRTDAWFKRHTKRNSDLRDTLVKSNYMAQYLGSKALTQTGRGLGKIASWGVRITGVVVGAVLVGGVIYLLAQSGGGASGEGVGYLLAGAVAAGYAIYVAGERLDHDIQKSMKKEEESKRQDLHIYRMVRFLPTWIGLGICATNPPENATIVRLRGSSVRTRVALVNHY